MRAATKSILFLVCCALCIHARVADAQAVAFCAATQTATPAYRDRIATIDRELGVPDDYAESHALQPVPEASTLVIAGHDIRGRPVRLAPPAAVALQEMLIAADAQGVKLQIVSGYRSVNYQAGLLRDKLHHGMKLDSALRINAPPGYSEHESGCAVDLTAPHSKAVDAGFGHTRAYAWMTKHAGN